MTAIAEALEAGKTQIAAVRAQHLALKRAKPIIYFYKNNIDGTPGAIYAGRVNVRDSLGYQFPKRKNVSSQAQISIRASHYISKWIASVPNDPNECKNIIVRVDMYGGDERWSGIGHHWKAETKDGCDVITFWINDDMQVPQFLLAPPNPILPIPIFQFPRVWPEFGPGVWCINLLFLLNIARSQVEESVWQAITLPVDPMNIGSWAEGIIDSLNPADWQVHIQWTTTFLTDSSLWNVLASRMNTIDSVIADALDDGQLCLDYRRYFPDEGEAQPTDLLTPTVANGALVLNVTDRSGFTLPGGTFFNGSIVGGATRSVLTWSDGFIEDVLTPVSDNETLYPDEYWQSGFLGSFASAPSLCLRDSHWNDLQSAVNYSEATAVTVVVGGDNPTADAIAKLIIESVGNLLGYFLLGGFDSLGDIASDVIMPFLQGTIAAWDTWTNTGRLSNLGWIHLWEVFQSGADNNSWSLTALATLRGGFDATRPETSHTLVVDDRTWVIPGLHCQIGDRVMSTSGCLQRMGQDILFIDQIEEMDLVGGPDGAFSYQMKVGQNRAALTAGERSARMLKKAMDAISNIGVHLVS